MSGDTPKKVVGKRGRKPRETNDISKSDFCRICKCTFRISFGNFGKEKAGYISRENIFEVSEKKPRLVLLCGESAVYEFIL